MHRAVLAEGLGSMLLAAAVIGSGTMGQFLSEMIATAGLIAVASTCTTPSLAAWRVPAWIGAAHWFTASTSFANPAITIARALSDTFAGIRLIRAKQMPR